MTKIGMEMTTRVSSSTVVSTGRPRRSPVMTPAVMPMTISKTIATIVSRGGDGERRRHQLGDRLAVERGAEVAGEDVAHVGQVLLPERLVEAELRHGAGRRRRVGTAVAAQARDRVARQR